MSRVVQAVFCVAYTSAAHLEATDLCRVGHVGPSAELHAAAGDVHHAHHVAVLLAEHGGRPGCLGLRYRHGAHSEVVRLLHPQ
eukprot:scaffold276091_cov36-Prasinocladus_malaysianus.AAC.1